MARTPIQVSNSLIKFVARNNRLTINQKEIDNKAKTIFCACMKRHKCYITGNAGEELGETAFTLFCNTIQNTIIVIFKAIRRD